MAFHTCGPFSSDFSDSESDYKPRNKKNKSRRAVRSNTKKAVASRMRRLRQKQHVEELEQEVARLNSKIMDLKEDYDQKWETSARQVAYLHNVLAKNYRTNSEFRNSYWSYSINPRGSGFNMTLNELNSGINVENTHSAVSSSSMFDDNNVDLSTEKDNCYQSLDSSPIALQNDEGWALYNGTYQTIHW